MRACCLVLALGVVACTDGTAPTVGADLGAYALASLDGQALPAPTYTSAIGQHAVLGGTLTLRGLTEGQRGTRSGFWTLLSVERVTRANARVDTIQYSDSGYYWSSAPFEAVMTFVNRDVPDFSFSAIIDGASLRAVLGGIGAIGPPSHAVFTRRP